MLEGILEASLRTSLLMLVVMLGLAVLRVRNVFVRRTVWTVVLLAAVAMPVLMQWPSWVVHSATLRPTSFASAAPIMSEGTWIAAVYLSVSAMLLARFAFGMLQAWRIKRGATRIHEAWAGTQDVRATDSLRTPATFGNTILLPADHMRWPSEKLAAVLAHESAHVRHHDSYVQWLATLYRSLFWLNPLAWWLERQLAQLAELTSDAVALAQMGDRGLYIEVLRNIATPTAHSHALVGMASLSSVSRRIQRLRAASQDFVRPKTSSRVAAALLLIPCIALAGVTSMSEPGANKPQIVWTGELEKWYPRPARQEGIEGFVVVGITLTGQGTVENAWVLSEKPEGHGFGDAAVAAAREFRFTNPAGAPLTSSFKVKFALHRKQE
jgi:TonB family protein